ncbi:MAG: PAS domain S-box protein [Pseudomonadota bacterium]
MPDLQSETSLLKLIIQTAPDAIVTANASGEILSFSPAAERIFGFEEDEVRGRNLTCLMPEPYRSHHDGYMTRYLETGEKRIIGIGREIQAMRKSGEVFVAELAVGELQIGGKHLFTGFIRDVSDRVVAETQVRELHRRLERVARIQTLGEISSALAHEINQPLTAISNFAQAAERALDDDETNAESIRKSFATISEQALRAGEIIRRMRKMVDRGAADIRPEDVNHIIEEAVRLGRTTSPPNGPAIELDLADDLPMVLADRIQIQQVLLNLMNNAYEALEDDTQPLHITSELGPRDDRVLLRSNATKSEVIVTLGDTGPGIEPELFEHIFDPLVSNKRTGLGIGLAVCRSIIDAHGGRIWAENGESGAEFHFTLPTVELER